MSRGVDPPRHPADDHQAGRGEEPAELLRDSQPVGAGAARPDDGDGVAKLQSRHKRPVAAPEEPVRGSGVRGRAERPGSQARLDGSSRAGRASSLNRGPAAAASARGPRGRRRPARSPSRSAIVRETLSTRSCPRPLRRRLGVAVGQHRRRLVVHLARAAELRQAHLRVAASGSKPVLLALTRRDHPAPNARRVGRGRHAHVLRAGALDRDRDVDAVGERPAQLGAVTARRRRLAVALTGLLAAPTRAGIGGRHEHEATRKLDRVTRTDDRHPTLLEGLAQRLERLARELPELVQEQHPAVGERDLPGPRRRAAADQARGRDRVVRAP